MEIKATSKFDYETIKDFVRFSMFPNSNAKKYMTGFIIYFSVMTMVILLLMMIFGVSKYMLILLVLMIVFFAIMLFFYFMLPKIQYNALGKMKDAENEFTFYDDYIRASTNIEGMSGISEIKYSMIAVMKFNKKIRELYKKQLP